MGKMRHSFVVVPFSLTSVLPFLKCVNYIFSCWSARIPAVPAAHTRVPGTGMYQCRIHPHRQSFQSVCPGFGPDTLLLFVDPASDIPLSFFLVILCRRRASWMPLSLYPNTSAISDWYTSGCSATYAFSFSGSIFRKPRCSSSFSKFPASFSCFSHFCIVWSGYFEYLACFFQRMACLSVFYGSSPIFFE